ITAEHVKDAGEFPAVLDEFRTELDGALVLAHNAGFDAGVMSGCARAYRVRAPRMRYLCPLSIARQFWPHLKSKALNKVAAYLGLDFAHLQVGEVFWACAEI